MLLPLFLRCLRLLLLFFRLLRLSPLLSLRLLFLWLLLSPLPPLSLTSSSEFSVGSAGLDFASYQASVLGLSQDYQYLARWYFQSGGSDFRAYLSAFNPHLSSDASCDFTSGSSVFFSALHAVTSLPQLSLAAPPLLSSSPAVPSSQPTAPPFSGPPSASLTSSEFSVGSAGLGGVRVGFCVGGVVCSSGISSSVRSIFSPFCASTCCFCFPFSASGCLCALSTCLFPLFFGSSCTLWLGLSPAVSVVPQLPPGPQPSLFRPFMVSDPPLLSSASTSAPLSSASLGSAAGPSGVASAASGSTYGHAGFPPQPGPPPAIPPPSSDSAAPLAPPLFAFAYPPDDPFAPGFADPETSGAAAPDPEALVPPPLSDSARCEVRCMYQYLVDLFPQAAGSLQAPLPPRVLFEEFFAAPSSPHQPVFLTWFERVCSTLAEADSRIASLLASGHPESSLLPPRNAQYSVGGGNSLGSAAPVNPSLLAMFERPLRPSLHLGLTVREAVLLESSSRALSESHSHSIWLLSGLLGFVRLQGLWKARG